MTVVVRTLSAAADPRAAQDLWYDVSRWNRWVDGFAVLVSLEGDWPHAGGELVWESRPHGRGRVSETVVEQDAHGQIARVADERLEAVQHVSFAAVPDGVEVTLELDYRLRSVLPVRIAVDWLFVRRALGDSLARTLDGFGHLLGAP